MGRGSGDELSWLQAKASKGAEGIGKKVSGTISVSRKWTWPTFNFLKSALILFIPCLGSSGSGRPRHRGVAPLVSTAGYCLEQVDVRIPHP